ncbi:MFS transporter [Phytohabitans kaempferiae]|uniref:MFS transporter n=1 Tax=Phytohabitans kaempferiae TaxID=1620943 RepID=A0ABV6MF98_9ACTN
MSRVDPPLSVGARSSRTGATAARWAVTVMFGVNGLVIASLAVRTPSLQQDLQLTTGQLGLLSALFGLTAVGTMQIAGSLTVRFGSRSLVRAASVVQPVLLLGMGVAPDFVTLAAVQMMLGAVVGLLDVSVNAHAVTVERALGRPIMNGCHAAWSLGSVSGALLGAGAAHIGLSRGVHYVFLTAVLVPFIVVIGRLLLPAAGEPTGARPGARTTWRTGWSRPVLVLGAMGAIALTAEAAVINWSGVFLHERQATLGVAGLGYAAFAVCQTSVRLIGDSILVRTSAAVMLRLGAGLTAAGLTVVVVSPWVALVVAGFALMGLGLATCLPVLYSVVGHLGADRESGSEPGADAGAAAMVARFTTMTYAGILLAPAVIGWVADVVGLTWTLAAIIPLLVAVAYAARTVTANPVPAK